MGAACERERADRTCGQAGSHPRSRTVLRNHRRRISTGELNQVIAACDRGPRTVRAAAPGRCASGTRSRSTSAPPRILPVRERSGGGLLLWPLPRTHPARALRLQRCPARDRDARSNGPRTRKGRAHHGGVALGADGSVVHRCRGALPLPDRPPRWSVHGLWRSQVAHSSGGRGVAGSSPASPTSEGQRCACSTSAVPRVLGRRPTAS